MILVYVHLTFFATRLRTNAQLNHAHEFLIPTLNDPIRRTRLRT